MTETVLPNHANAHGNILGGRVMHLIDLAGAGIIAIGILFVQLSKQAVQAER